DHPGLVVLQLHAARASRERAASADHAVGALDVARAFHVEGLPLEICGRCTNGETDAHAADPERIVVPLEGQNTATAADAHDDAALGENHPDCAGVCLRR